MPGTLSYDRRRVDGRGTIGGTGGGERATCRYYATERRRNRYSSFSIMKLFRRSKHCDGDDDDDSAWFRDDLQRIRQAYREQEPDYAAVTPTADRRRPAAAATWSRWSGSTTTVYSFAYVDGAPRDDDERTGRDGDDDDDVVEYIDAATLPVAHRRRTGRERSQTPSAGTSGRAGQTIGTSGRAGQTTGTMTATRRRNKRIAPPPPAAQIETAAAAAAAPRLRYSDARPARSPGKSIGRLSRPRRRRTGLRNRGRSSNAASRPVVGRRRRDGAERVRRQSRPSYNSSRAAAARRGRRGRFERQAKNLSVREGPAHGAGGQDRKAFFRQDGGGGGVRRRKRRGRRPSVATGSPPRRRCTRPWPPRT
ncbi:unnamed protein product [Aphis gossypii]|uniref:Uncharacterized protein n=1 Tax=Aphis gossypii TaxID=80765 RepID=A0A9P0J6L0_APHGO|nr:unnamed protein product [Aphis gossypii]